VTEQGGVFDFIRARGEEFFTRMSNELMSNPRFIKAMQAALRGKEWVDGAVGQALKTMNVPTRTEFKRALARIETLERELADTRREAAAAAAHARKLAASAHRASSGAARARRKKTGTRKPRRTARAGAAPATSGGSAPAE
jgi:hypothetical protein